MIPDIVIDRRTKIPQVGFGLWLNKDREECIASVVAAAKAGYRHFDTAQAYGNEAYLAEGLEKAGLKREDVFITTKIAVQNFLKVEKSFGKSLENLKSDYADLLLLHLPASLGRNGACGHREKL